MWDMRVGSRSRIPFWAKHSESTWELHRFDKEDGMSKVGFVGLGIMGAPMAGHLRAGGHELFVYDVKPAPKSLTDQGAIVCGSAKEVAEKSDIIISMVPDTPHVAAVLFGENGVASGLSKGKIVVDMSSISPIETKRFAQKIEALGCQYLDAPVSGGEVGAKAASLTIMVGGPEDAFEKVKSLLDLMGKNVTLVGGNGDGQTCKVANLVIEQKSAGMRTRLTAGWASESGFAGISNQARRKLPCLACLAAIEAQDGYTARFIEAHVRRCDQRAPAGALHSASSADCT